MNVVFLGTSSFAVPSLELLDASAHRVRLVVTRPDRPRGRGRETTPAPIADAAKKLDLDVFRPERVNAPEAVARIRAAEPDLIVVVAYGQILGKELLSLAPQGIVNLHGSLLPAYRGAAPIARAVQDGLLDTGVSLQFVAAELDSGDVIDKEPVAIGPDETAGELTERMAPIAARLLARNLDKLARGTAPRERQAAAAVTWAPPLKKTEGRIPWTLPAHRVHAHIRAMTPWPGAFTEWPRATGPLERLIVRTAEVRRGGANVPPGTVVRSDGVLDVATADGLIRIERLLRSGKRETDAESFLNGLPIPLGAVFR